MGGGGHMPHPFTPSDDIDPQATRSLFVGNIPKNISVYQLRDIFQRYGDVLVCLHWLYIPSPSPLSHTGGRATFFPHE